MIESHIAVDEDTGKADCSVCHMGITAPPSFGGIPRSEMLANFIVQHTIHKAGRPDGLTPGGKPTKKVREHFARAKERA